MKIAPPIKNMSVAMNVIEVQNAVKNYGSQAVLRDINMNVKSGTM